jgi:DNA polymerase V
MRPGATGFPSPADDYVEVAIDLNVELIPRPLSTFFMRVSGAAMRGDGIVDGDLLVIDRSVDARHGMVVLATHEGSFLVRRLRRSGGHLWLTASDAAVAPIPLGGDRDGGVDGAELWGVVLHAVHHLARAPSWPEFTAWGSTDHAVAAHAGTHGPERNGAPGPSPGGRRAARRAGDGAPGPAGAGRC